MFVIIIACFLLVILNTVESYWKIQTCLPSDIIFAIIAYLLTRMLYAYLHASFKIIRDVELYFEYNSFISIHTLWFTTFAQTSYPPWNNIAPENGWLEYDRFLLGWPIFRGELLVSGSVTHIAHTYNPVFKFHLWDTRTRPRNHHLPSGRRPGIWSPRNQDSWSQGFS